jgi:mitochondrial fission protein ELM1
MHQDMKRPIIWALLLPEAGFRSQVLGLAEAMNGELVEKNIDLRKPWSLLPANLCPFPLLGLDPALDKLEAPWPDVVIACGGRSIAPTLAVQRASGGRTVAVYIQNPKGATKHFDLVVSMRHDGLNDPNVMVVDTAIHRITPAKLDAARTIWNERLSDLPRPLVSVILGGRSRSLRFTSAVADTLIERLKHLSQASGASLIVTPSRRTEPEIVARFKAFADANLSSVRLWDGQGDKIGRAHV